MNRKTLLVAVAAFMAAMTSVEGGKFPDEWVTESEKGNMIISETLPSDGAYVPHVGNGYIAAIPTSDVMYVSGLFNGRHSETPSHRAKVSFPFAVSVTNKDDGSSVYALDIKGAAFLERLTTGSGSTSVELRWFAPYHMMNVVTLEVDITAGPNSDAKVTFSVNNKTHTGDMRVSTLRTSHIPAGTAGFEGKTRIPEDPTNTSASINSIVLIHTNVPKTVIVPAGTQRTLRFVCAVHTTLDTLASSLVEATAETYNNAMKQGSDLLARHRASWADIWESGLEVGGFADLAQGVNSSLYYILSSVRPDWPYGLSPGSLSSNSYNGHSFWDTETWMYPTLALLYPGCAESLLEYRIARLPGARTKAKSYTPPYSGAMYPWESALTGIECTPTWAATGVREIHIAGDISLAALQYWNMTRDKAWLEHALPMLQEIADFWVSKAEFHAETGEYWITDVIPPDEYADHVNNSVYTNAAAQISLNVAIMALEIFGKKVPAEYREVAAKIRIPFDATLRVHPEYDGYNGGQIKQADVVLLGYPLQVSMPADVRENDLAYYIERTDPNGPAMTYGMHTLGWLELGNEEKAAELFARTYANMRAPFKVWAETPSGGAVNFITGAGGFLQTVWAGYGGVRINNGGFSAKPVLPKGVSSLKVRGIRTLGGFVDMSFDGNEIEVLLRKAGTEDLCAVVGTDITKLSVGKPVRRSALSLSVVPCN